jgi:uncharacterized protein with GYD domain
MPKYLFQATYTAEGIKGLEKDKAVGRNAALSKAVESFGGKLEALYWAFGEHDWVLIADLPDNASATAFSFAVSGAAQSLLGAGRVLSRRQAKKGGELARA